MKIKFKFCNIIWDHSASFAGGKQPSKELPDVDVLEVNFKKINIETNQNIQQKICELLSNKYDFPCLGWERIETINEDKYEFLFSQIEISAPKNLSWNVHNVCRKRGIDNILNFPFYLINMFQEDAKEKIINAKESLLSFMGYLKKDLIQDHLKAIEVDDASNFRGLKRQDSYFMLFKVNKKTLNAEVMILDVLNEKISYFKQKFYFKEMLSSHAESEKQDEFFHSYEHEAISHIKKHKWIVSVFDIEDFDNRDIQEKLEDKIDEAMPLSYFISLAKEAALVNRNELYKFSEPHSFLIKMFSLYQTIDDRKDTPYVIFRQIEKTNIPSVNLSKDKREKTIATRTRKNYIPTATIQVPHEIFFMLDFKDNRNVLEANTSISVYKKEFNVDYIDISIKNLHPYFNNIISIVMNLIEKETMEFEYLKHVTSFVHGIKEAYEDGFDTIRVYEK